MTHLGTAILMTLLAVIPIPANQQRFSVLNISPDTKVSVGNFRLDNNSELLGYRMHVKNTSSKIITELTWIYEAEVRNYGRKKYVEVNGETIKTRILPEEEKRFDIPPTPDKPLTYRLLLTRVEFADGTVWKRPQNKGR